MLLPLMLTLAALPAVPHGTTIAVDPRGTWVVDEETDAVVLVPASGENRRVAVGRWPQQLVVEPNGRVFVSCRQDGRVAVISPDFTVRFVDVGAEPSALYLDEAHHRLFVGLVTGRELVRIDTGRLEVDARRKIDAEPAALELTPDGLAVLSRRGGEVGFVAPELAGGIDWWVSLQSAQPGARAWRGIAMAMAGADLVVVHTRVDTGQSQVGGGGLYGGGASEEPIVAAVSVLSHARLAHSWGELPLHDISGLAVEGKRIAFASAGDGQLAFGTWATSHAPFDLRTVEAGAGLSGVAFDTSSTLIGLAAFDRTVVRAGLLKNHVELGRARQVMKEIVARARPPLPAHTELAGAVVSNVFGLSNGSLEPRSQGLAQLLGAGGGLGRLGDLSAKGSPTRFVAEPFTLAVLHKRALPQGRFDAELARGRRLFHATGNGAISRNGLGCVSCHPDGREDGLVWRLNGTRRQTPLLAGRLADTAPYNWKGTGDTLVTNIRQTTERLGGDGLSAADQRALARFLVEGLRPVTLPEVAEPALVAKGSALFHDAEVGCATCHPSDDGFTDGQPHDVDSLQRREVDELKEAGAPTGKDARQFDAPDLRSLAITAPYFHDGSVASLETLLEENGDRMGHTRGLSAEERAALAAYLRSL